MYKIPIKGKPTILKNKDFQTIRVGVFFPYIIKDDELALNTLLPEILNRRCMAYPTEESLRKEIEKNYILLMYASNSEIGDYGYFSFRFEIPDTYALGKNILEDQFKLLHELIYNPFVKDDEFDSFDLERAKKNLNNGLDDVLKNVRAYHGINLLKLVDDEGTLSRDIINDRGQIDLVTPKNLYEFYLSKIQNNQPSIYIMGNVDEEEMVDLCNKYLYLNKSSNKTLDAELDFFLKPRESVLEKCEDSKFHDSCLSIVYKVHDMKKSDFFYLSLLNSLLSSTSSKLLDKKLRDENDYVYSSRTIPYPRFGLFRITTYIQKESLNDVKEKIFEVIKDLKDEKLISPLLENIIDRARINLIKKLDDKDLIYYDFVIHDLGIDYTQEEYYEAIKNITAKDISLFVDRLILDTIYFLKEGNYE